MFMLMDHCLSRVRAYEVLKEPRPVMSQETLTGATLAYLINTNRRRLALSDVVNLGIHLCSAVQYLHRHNVLHLDLKPSNVVSERQLAKVIDLSITRSPARDRKGARTPQYMAPEQARGGYLSPATDVWGTSRLRPAKSLSTPTMKTTNPATCKPRDGSPRSHRRVPVRFANLVESCLEPDPAQRSTVQGLMKALTAYS